MQYDGQEVESRFDELSARLRSLEVKVDELAEQVLARAPAARALPPRESPTRTLPHAPGRAPSPISAPVALSALAIICFLLVMALILRTLTESQIVNQEFGAFLGMAYAAMVVLFGYNGYTKKQRYAPLYVACGAFLLLSIVFETHARFQVLSAPLAYTLLGAAIAAMTVLGLRSGSALLISVGVLGSAFTGLALEFPDPLFPCLAGLLFLANVAAYVSGRTGPGGRCAWLKWPILAFTMFFWFLWTVKARIPLVRGYEPPIAVGVPWILPALAAFLAGSFVITTMAVLQKKGAVGFYEIVVVPVAAAGAVAVSETLLIPYCARPGLASAIGAACALAPMSLALWFSTKGEKGTRTAPALAVAAFIPLAAFLPGCVTSASLSVLACSIVAAGTAVFPLLARNGSVRVVSHLFQAVACGMAVWFGCLSVHTPLSAGRMSVIALLGGICIAHYGTSRVAVSGNADSEKRTDPAFYSAVLPLMAGLLYIFGFARIVLFLLVARAGAGGDAFQAGQSILINATAITVAMVGIGFIYGDIVIVAVAIAVLGAMKVFVYDFPHLHGIPIVLSVSSFGVTAALGGVLWTRWQKRAETLASPPA